LKTLTQLNYIKIKEYEMKLIKPILTITAISSLIACSGGGGGGGSGDDNGANENESNLISNQSVDTTSSEEAESSSIDRSVSSESAAVVNTAASNSVSSTSGSSVSYGSAALGNTEAGNSASSIGGSPANFGSAAVGSTETENSASSTSESSVSFGSAAVENTAAGNSISQTDDSTNQSASMNHASFAKVDNTAEIVSNDSFMFKSSKKVAIDIVVPSNLNKTDYLTVCLGDEATAFVDYSQCILKTPITSLQFTGELTLKNDTQSLALVLLDYDQPNSPHVSFWNRLDNPTLISL
jgi:hypothetical protein